MGKINEQMFRRRNITYKHEKMLDIRNNQMWNKVMMTFSPYQIGKGKKDLWKAIVVTGGGGGRRTLTTVNGGINCPSRQKVIWQPIWEPEISLMGIFPKETNPWQEADVHKHCLFTGPRMWLSEKTDLGSPVPTSTQDMPFWWLSPVNAGTGRTQGFL